VLPVGSINIDYIHRNPVLRGLVATPEDWRYSSAHEGRDGARCP
jgi:hypothetical protein